MGTWTWGWLTLTIEVTQNNYPDWPWWVRRRHNIRLMPWPVREVGG